MELIGKRFGNWTVLREAPRRGKHKMVWCRCGCGVEREVYVDGLIRGTSRSCGCLHYKEISGPRKDLSGQKINDFTVIEYVGSTEKGLMWRCRCKCGEEEIIPATKLRTAGSRKFCKSCCHKKISERMLIHGESGATGNTNLYHSWCSMKNRCRVDSKLRPFYSGKGISVCKEWENYQTFRQWAYESGYEEGLSLDRIDNDMGYCPENCRWVEWIDQANNKSNNRFFEYNGKVQTVAQWAREYDMDYFLLYARLVKLGWPIERALFQPKKNLRPKNTHNYIKNSKE